VRLGIRAQLLLSVAGLLLLGLVPLLFAVTSLARASLRHTWEQGARSLGRAIAGHVGEARQSRSPSEVEGLLEAQLGDPVGAIGIYDASGKLVRRAGDKATADALPAEVTADKEQVLDTGTAEGRAIIVLVPVKQGPVAVLLYTSPEHLRAGPLAELVALYTGLLGLGLLGVLYFALTRIVVHPVEQLSGGARRVVEGAKTLHVTRSGGRELQELATSLEQMTALLRGEEAKLQQKVRELEAATDGLKRAQDGLVRSERLASVGRLAAGLAHEIGNPVTAVLGLLELVLEGGLEPAEERDFLERIRKETERVSRVLRDLLDFARPAAGSGADSAPDGQSQSSMQDALEHVVALLRPQKAFAGVELVTEIDAPLPAVAMRQARVEQVLLNLLLNAADAVPATGGKIRIQAHGAAEAVCVAIEDNGGGIDPAVRGRLFEPFVTSKDPGKGTGLGLAVCRGLIEAAGGHIELEDGTEGARFVLELPRTKLQSESSGP